MMPFAGRMTFRSTVRRRSAICSTGGAISFSSSLSGARIERRKFMAILPECNLAASEL